MAMFGREKVKNEKYLIIKEFVDNVNTLLSNDEYISNKMYETYYNKAKETFDYLKGLEEENLLNDFCRKNKIKIKQLNEYIDLFDNIKSLIDNHNEEYVKAHLESDKEYLDKILEADDPNILLDEEQRRVVLNDADYTLVVAGAGAGKTTTIEAKVKYLVEKKGIDPHEILIISFTRKATQELKDRINSKLNINAEIATFHSIGNTIIHKEDETRNNIVNMGFMYNVISNYLKSKLDDEAFVSKIVLFFSSYLNVKKGLKSTSQIHKELAMNKFTTLKTDLSTIESMKKDLIKSKKSFNNERCRSIDEVRIANFLFINSIEYVYEPVYKFCFDGSIKTYRPDFLLKQGDKVVYLEHFGLDEYGNNSSFSKEDIEKYKKGIVDKIRLHREHGTKLIYTWSAYKDGRDLIVHLEEELKKAGFVLSRKDDGEIYKKLISYSEDKYLNKFTELVCNFISKIKINNYDISIFDDWEVNVKDERTKLFLYIAKRCYLIYEKELNENNAIDFSDMINNASIILNKYIDDGKKLGYKYIFVDEYQDISLQRFNLCERLSKCSDAKIIAVGDDWQSIYRFSGSRLGLFTAFEKVMPSPKVLKITSTYRNSQELIDIAGGFIMENDEQIKKDLKSPKHIDNPVVLMTYDDRSDISIMKTPYYRMCEALENAIGEIVKEYGDNKNILVIGRYGFDFKNLSKISDKFIIDNYKKTIVSLKYPNAKLYSYTAHSSKGLGFDNVIIINAKDDVLGFPSKIEDDPIMQLVIKKDEEVEYAEERRLFYVALTRTKNKVYIITPKTHPSKFVLEIKESSNNVSLNGEELTPKEQIDLRRKCPYCGYPLQYRTAQFSSITNSRMYICSNDPELCGFITNDISGGSLSISKCPKCEDGYLIVKKVRENEVDSGKRMLGCTNFTPDKKGCNFKMFSKNFTQNKQKALSLMNEVDISSLIVFDVEIKVLITKIIETIKVTNEKVPWFSFGTSSLANFICGNTSKSLEKFKLNDKIPNFGIISANVIQVIILLKVMSNFELIEIGNDKYSSIRLLTNEVDDDICIEIFRELKFK